MSAKYNNNTMPFNQAILQWFDQHGRKDLPWQKDINAYRVWISEIMLQQTQVKTVIPYYEKFIHHFPTIQSLAQAEQDDVLHHWSGLGYYSRARNLHKSAQTICQQYNGEMPSDPTELEQLPGIGRSTAGAIAAIAFHQHAAILDGNVKRVLARYFAIAGWPGKKPVSNQLWTLAESNTPEKRVADYTQAIMDLGATLCTRSKPQCTQCPVANGCVALESNRVTEYPGKKPKKIIPTKTTEMLIVANDQGEVLLRKRPPTGVWAGLWSLPEKESLPSTFKFNFLNSWPVVRHTFSHFHLDITPTECTVKPSCVIMEPDQWLWYDLNNPAKVGLAAPVSKLLNAFSLKESL